MEKLLEKIRAATYYIVAAIDTVLLLLAMAMDARAAHLHHEKYYQQLWCDANGGVAEFVLSDATRVDCLTTEYAIEFDFAGKWAESIGQSLYYGYMTGRKPGVVLIIENPNDRRYLPRIRTVADELNIKLWTMDQGVE